ncbi:hypothetical protein [Paenibacillus tianmuensis]|uniref:hypothetical protein n=1 Tax=Paenibacillus tianmuensis TaxID=624147 RepID=UPI000B822068|nr:hypothetical protein [Paenibacillus tianmuensis]
MNDDIISPQELRFRNELNQILPNAYDRIDDIESFPESIGTEILAFFVGYACHPQNWPLIELARNKIKTIPSKWLLKHLPEVARTTICFEDDWEYRRLLELISEAAPILLNWGIEQGVNSTNEEVREAAEDFMGQ